MCDGILGRMIGLVGKMFPWQQRTVVSFQLCSNGFLIKFAKNWQQRNRAIVWGNAFVTWFEDWGDRCLLERTRYSAGSDGNIEKLCERCSKYRGTSLQPISCNPIRSRCFGRIACFQMLLHSLYGQGWELVQTGGVSSKLEGWSCRLAWTAADSWQECRAVRIVHNFGKVITQITQVLLG